MATDLKTIHETTLTLIDLVKEHGGGIVEVQTSDMTLSVEVEGDRWKIGPDNEDQQL